MSISVLAISFDAHDAAQLALFWAQALHRTVNDSATEEFASIAADTDSRLGPLLMFHKVPEGKTLKNRVHIDLQAADVVAEAEPADKPGRPADSLIGRQQQPLDQLTRPRRQRVRPRRNRMTLSHPAQPIPPITEGNTMTEIEQRNKALVLDAFDTLFNKRDYAAAERFWSPDYIQHSAHIEPGREGLFGLVKAAPPDMEYENALITANGDYVMLHGRFWNVGQPANWIVADIVRIEDGLLAEHWDVIQDEATAEESQSGLPMFGDTFPHRPDTEPATGPES